MTHARVAALENSLMLEALNASRVGICVIGEGGDVILMNEVFGRKIELRPVDMIGRTARRLLDCDCMRGAPVEDLINLSAAEVSAQVIPPTGSLVALLLLRATTLFDPEHGRYRVLSALDINDFGMSRTRLIESKRQLEAVASAVVISDVRLADGPIVLVNRRFEQMTGYRSSEVLGRNCRFLQGSDRAQPPLAELRRAIQAQQPCHVVLRNYRKNGERFLNELFISPIFDGAGEVTHFIGLQKELTDRQIV